MKGKSKPEKHDVSFLFLDNNWIEKGMAHWCPTTLKTRVEDVKKWLEEVLANPQHCSVCGALKYGFVLDHDGKEYAFALWKITDKTKKKSKIVGETDYTKLGSYFTHYGEWLARRKNNRVTRSALARLERRL